MIKLKKVRRMDFTSTEDHRVKIRENKNKKLDKYQVGWLVQPANQPTNHPTNQPIFCLR